MAAFTRGVLLALWLVPVTVNAQSLFEFYRHALETNPAVRSREFGVEQAKAQESLAASRLRPQLLAIGNYYWNDYRESGSPERRYDGVRGSLQVRQALLDLASYFKLQGAHSSVSQSEQEREAARMSLGGDVVDRYLAVLQATVRDARARYEIARERHEGARREIERAARTAYLSAVASHARIGSTGEEVRALEKVLDAQHKSYELGVATILDVLIAQRRLFKSRSDRSKARYDHIRDLTVLRIQSGSLGPRDIEEIDGWMARNGRAKEAPRQTEMGAPSLVTGNGVRAEIDYQLELR